MVLCIGAFRPRLDRNLRDGPEYVAGRQGSAAMEKPSGFVIADAEKVSIDAKSCSPYEPALSVGSFAIIES